MSSYLKSRRLKYNKHMGSLRKSHEETSVNVKNLALGSWTKPRIYVFGFWFFRLLEPITSKAEIFDCISNDGTSPRENQKAANNLCVGSVGSTLSYK